MVENRELIVITGPTASGKTALAIEMAKQVGGHVISADSRQIYKGIPIGTAVPTPEERAAVPHHFVEVLDLDQYYSAAQYEADAMRLLDELFQQNPRQVMCGGSMMYVDAVCNGIDELPTISDSVRQRVLAIYGQEGLYGIRQMLQLLDPALHDRTDPANPRRNLHALELCLQAGRPDSELLTGEKKQRPFKITKYAIDWPREELFDRINRRVELMIEQGLEEEARRVYPLRHLNSLNTVGYKEMFAYFDGLMDFPTSIARIQKNTRVYAKKQLTWLRRDPSIIWIAPEALSNLRT
ncbi:MAG: tRNA (adenosine(37)-N6)-dimethylallyltransferase MiaA [Bacteroidales bacterium]|nr:tRNA (adenosine(37)-N6)-dimethylallyltransferase MiaA [Bacteroidales bacterium]